jgi:predicted dehydrogenase
LTDRLSSERTIRFGVLGTGRVVQYGLLRPAHGLPGVEVSAVASRFLDKASRYASAHGIPRAWAGYQTLLDDEEIDAVYNALPNSLHCQWTIRALEAGKHVLCEKPIAANAGEATQMAAAAQRTGLVLAEAFHWRYHPLAARMKGIVDSGELGSIRHFEGVIRIPIRSREDSQCRLDLAGGATMNCGCYVVNMLRFLSGAEPEVVEARATVDPAGVDQTMIARFAFADGRTGKMICSHKWPALPQITARVTGEHGELRVWNPIVPHVGHRVLGRGLHWLTVRTRDRSRREHVAGDSTYRYQLRAFADAIRRSVVLPTGPGEAVANMRVIDSIYRSAGLAPRGAAVSG